ncbi:nucleotidyltransferase domain-containing protein [Serratia marcescens]|uniref:nucleotidyltransferase domain-containing protein n=1 Tax=Serratia marcescens TaxID=615 RepID=UPI00293389D9|nr:nucleotidyltransferase domain-containing protein [Serratia marcescens]MDV2100106.1 nucleotidyltransferase domain-containing protein [Serratia marcescens]
MNIKSLAIYGSTARGEQTDTSDVDMFAIYDGLHYKMVVKGKLNIAMYPMALAEKIMEGGSLFALHLKEEGVSVFNEELFEKISSSFRYKENYSKDIDTATKLLQFICTDNKKIKNKFLMNKRVSWCVRTILISLSAEMRTPLFSKESLAMKFSTESITYQDISTLIALKSSQVDIKNTISICYNFLSVYGMRIDDLMTEPFLRKSIKNLTNGNDTLLNY